MQPALAGSKLVMGPAATVIRVVLLGPDKALPAHKPMGGNQMPAFDTSPYGSTVYVRGSCAPLCR